MIPRPIYKLLAAVLLPILPLGSLWLWFACAAEPKGYYLSWRSGFLYERLLLPQLPPLPGTTPEREHYTLLGVRCGKQQLCFATPWTFAARMPTVDLPRYRSAARVRAELDRYVYQGNPLDTLMPTLASSLAVWLLLFLVAAILDYRRREKHLNGMQILGRWPTLAHRFSGLFAGWFKHNVLIDVEVPNDKIAPL